MLIANFLPPFYLKGAKGTDNRHLHLAAPIIILRWGNKHFGLNKYKQANHTILDGAKPVPLRNSNMPKKGLLNGHV